MMKVIQIALNDLRIALRERGAILNLVFMPILFILLIGFVNGGFDSNDSSQRVRLDVLNADVDDAGAPTAMALSFLQAVRDVNPQFDLCPMDNNADDLCALEAVTLDAEEAKSRVESGVTQGIIEIPAGFEQSIRNGNPVNVVFRSNTDSLQPNAYAQSVQAAAGRIGGAAVAAQLGELAYQSTDAEGDSSAFQAEVYEQAVEDWTVVSGVVDYRLSANPEEEATSNITGFGQSVPGMGSMYVMFTVLAGTVLLLQERRQWTLQRMVMMPLSRAQILGGKMLARFLTGMLQYGVAFGFGALLGVDFGSDLLALVLLMMAFSAAMTAIAFLLATFVKTDMQASGISTFFSLTTAPLGGAWWPLEIVPAFMQTLAFLTPIGWVMDGFGKLIFYGGTLSDVVLNIVVLFGLAAVVFAIGITRFKYD